MLRNNIKELVMRALQYYVNDFHVFLLFRNGNYILWISVDSTSYFHMIHIRLCVFLLYYNILLHNKAFLFTITEFLLKIILISMLNLFSMILMILIYFLRFHYDVTVFASAMKKWPTLFCTFINHLSNTYCLD